MAGFEAELESLRGLDASVVAASVDDAEKAAEVAADLSFPVAHGVTRADAEVLGAWWEERRNIIQPSEFVLGTGGRILTSTYSSGPIGRIDAADVVKMINFLEAQKKK